MIRDAASKRLAGDDNPAAVKRGRSRVPHPLTWLNIVCLDAPLVAISWQWLFAQSFDVAVPSGAAAALFFTAWLIYLADRLGDSLSIDRRLATSLRQRFCLEHRGAWIVAVVCVATVDALIAATLIGGPIMLWAAPVALLAIAYLFLNQRRPALWRVLPVKEITIGVLFAAGTIVAVVPEIAPAATWPWLMFAALCSLNCISIAAWERWLDQAQQRVSIATVLPSAGSSVLPALVLLASASGAAARSELPGQPIFACLTISASLLALVHLFRRRIQSDVRTALADLVLLLPPLLGAIT